jgi:DNA mismatch repair protein MutL
MGNYLMNKIKILPPEQIKKIAAGEVVERPVNIVKELVENALDAHATQITLYLEDGGKALIRVVDNGIGMSEQDAQLCFEHHATSKLHAIEDLESLNSFGFRGEALSSIAAVSSVTLITKTQDAPHGTTIAFEGSKLIEQSATSAVQGTDIQVRDLFGSIPARKKFLKTRETEWRQIQILMNAFCLSNLDTHFKVIHDKKVLINCPPAQTLKERVEQLQQHRVAQNLLPLTAQKEGIALEGYCTNHTFYNYDRSALFCYVNGRWVKNLSLSRAIMKGYQNVLPAGRFPAGCFHITLSKDQIDVNVHPKKEEISFLHPRKVETLISSSIKTALEHAISKQLQQVTPARRDEPFSIRSPFEYALKPISFSFNQPIKPVRHMPLPEAMQQESIAHLLPTETERNFSIMGQYKKTYIMVEQETGLLFVDQHAAQERILYEQFGSYFDNVPIIPLLFPQTIHIPSEEFQHLEHHLELFKNYGVIIEIFGKDQIIVTSTPAHLKHILWRDIVHQVIAWNNESGLLPSEKLSESLDKKLRAQMACKAAIKAGDVLNTPQMQQLIDDLIKTDNRFSCPHGRPTSWLFLINDLEKKFKRRT